MPRANTKSDFDSESVRMHTEACSILIFDFKPAFCPNLANNLLVFAENVRKDISKLFWRCFSPSRLEPKMAFLFILSTIKYRFLTN